MSDYKTKSIKRKEQFELLSINYRNMRRCLPHCCDKPLIPPHVAASSIKEFSWYCSRCKKYYLLEKKLRDI